MAKLPLIETGYHLFAADGGEEFGAVREVMPGGNATLRVNIENGGDFVIPLDAVASVHSQKVIIDVKRLDPEVQQAISRAHEAEEPHL